MADPVPALRHALAGRYAIERELGHGGMATVWLAQDLRHDRPVAVKVLRTGLAESLGRGRFLREIRLAAGLAHPHILPLYDSGEATDPAGHPILYYVMPVMEGQTLRDRLVTEKRLPVEDALRLALEVADALDYAHRHDVVHRDIKPENILLHEGHAIVADFGIGKALAAAGADSSTHTQVGVTVGTPAYMSPEQAVGEPVDGRSDLFALGCVLYEMLTGEPAFDGPTAQAVIARRFVHTPPPVRELRPEVPEAASAMTARLLAKEPADRPSTGALVASVLRSGEVLVAAPPRDDKSLAVLPFEDRSAEPDPGCFADGLTEELITDLGRVKALRVISRTSVMQLRGTTKGIREVGRELGVRYVLEGSVRRAGHSLRITAQLVDARNDAQVWAERYSGTLDDVFELQERVSRAIVEALDITLSSDEDRRLADRPIADFRAFELYLQARLEIRRYNLERGIPLLEQAIAIAGEVPPLRALRAYAAITRVRAGIGGADALLDAAEAEARALVALLPDAAFGHALLGFIGYERGMLKGAVRSLRAAMERDPGDADVQFYLGICLIAAGQHEEAWRLSQRVLAADPLSSLAGMLAGVTSWFVGKAAEGIGSMERSLRRDPESLIHRWTMGYHYALVGRIADAAVQAEWLERTAPEVPYSVQLRALLAALEDRPADALALVRGVDIGRLDAHHTFHVAEVFVMAGDAARGLELLGLAVDRSFYPHDFLAAHCPFLAPVRGTPAFARIVEKAAERVREFSA